MLVEFSHCCISYSPSTNLTLRNGILSIFMKIIFNNSKQQHSTKVSRKSKMPQNCMMCEYILNHIKSVQLHEIHLKQENENQLLVLDFG